MGADLPRRTAHGRCPGALLADVGTGASDIADIVPEIRDLAAGPGAVGPPGGRRPGPFPDVRIRSGSSSSSLSRGRPALLVLDDLHWADAPSLRLLEFLAPEIADSRLLLIGTYRANELSRQHPLSDALGGLARAPHVTRIHLAGLTAEEVHEFIAAATGTTAAGVAGHSPSTPRRRETRSSCARSCGSWSSRVCSARPAVGIAAGDPHPRGGEGGDRAAPQSSVGGLQRDACASPR